MALTAYAAQPAIGEARHRQRQSLGRATCQPAPDHVPCAAPGSSCGAASASSAALTPPAQRAGPTESQRAALADRHDSWEPIGP